MQEIIDDAVRAAIDDALGHGWPDAGQTFQLFLTGGVQIDGGAGTRGAVGVFRPGNHCARAGDGGWRRTGFSLRGHVDLLAIGQGMGQIDGHKIGVIGSAVRPFDGVHHQAVGRQTIDAR